MTDIGVVGVGYIGKRFVDALSEWGNPPTVYDIDTEKTAYAVERGGRAAADAADVAAASDVVLLALPGTPEVATTFEGEDGLLAGLSAGDLVIDASTTHPDTSVACEQLCADAVVNFVEAPITGGAPRDGDHMMAGATEESYGRATEILDVLCADHIHVGPVPDATVLKLGLQLRYAGHHAVDAEVVEFVRDNGVDPEVLPEFFGFDMFDGYFSGEFGQEIEGLGTRAIWQKDLGYAREFAREQGTALPLTGVVHQAYKATDRRAAAEAGHASALIQYWLARNDAMDRDDR
jgi:3-hydroxyisobutyrate dehydrogenase-like beta-hydroxyacid dehydrogenase